MLDVYSSYIIFEGYPPPHLMLKFFPFALHSNCFKDLASYMLSLPFEHCLLLYIQISVSSQAYKCAGIGTRDLCLIVVQHSHYYCTLTSCINLKGEITMKDCW